MKLIKISLFILIVSLVSCKKDNASGGVIIQERDRTEQQIVDNDSIIGYLKKHYYNKSQFDGNTNPKIKNLVITEITDEIISSDADSLLVNAVETKSLVFYDVDYQYYILRLNQGGQQSPTFADNIRVTYQGFTLDDNVFDSAVTEVELDLTGLIAIWRKVMPQFNTAESFVENGDGTIDYFNHGIGVMFVPSGLAYFPISANSGNTSFWYSPLIFKFELYKMTQNDHDGDGVPSYKEDLNGDGEFIVNFTDLTDDTDDDTDGDGNPDYVDSDDDGDGILTINEDLNEDGDPTNDIGANGIPNYLDPKETASKNDN